MRRTQPPAGGPILVLAVLTMFVAVIAAACGQDDVALPDAVAGQVTTIDSAQGEALMRDGGALVVDVRTVDEYRSGHLVGAQSIPVEDPELWNARTAPLDRGRPTIVYCRSGRRSLAAAQMLVEAGFTEVYDLGGVQDWNPDDLQLDR